MKASSAKAKGRVLQQWMANEILKRYSTLTPDDVRSTSSGANGVDVQLSQAAQKLFPFCIECKNIAAFTGYRYFDQAVANTTKGEPLVVVKANRRRPLVLIDAEVFMNIYQTVHVLSDEFLRRH